MATLKQNIRVLLRSARQSEDRQFVFAWPQPAGSIKVGVIQTRTGYVVLSLERLNLEPTTAEWKAVIAQWPEPVTEAVVPAPRKDGRRRALIGRWPRPAAVTEQAA